MRDPDSNCGPAPERDERARLLGLLSRLHERSQVLEAANRRLAVSERRKDAFIAMLSHELRNPLAPIRNGVEVLRRKMLRDDTGCTEALAVIDRQVDQLARLVDDLLDITRIARNKIPLRRERLELNELVRCTLADHRAAFAARDIELELCTWPHPLHVDADWNRLAQVVGNLVQNAAKFTKPGGRAIVSVSADARAGHAVVRVADTGVGMTSDVLDCLFEPFVQAERGLAGAEGGLGLGLALVKGLVERHGGSVAAHSDGLGKGAELTVRLPLAPVRSAPPAPPQASAPAHHRRRVLIIEDNTDAATSLRFALELDQHQVELADDGPTGLALARRFKPEIVLCDIGLPGMDGYEVARAFRADHELAGTFLVALSGYALPEDRTRATDAGFDEHLAKPATVESIEALFTRLPPG